MSRTKTDASTAQTRLSNGGVSHRQHLARRAGSVPSAKVYTRKAKHNHRDWS